MLASVPPALSTSCHVSTHVTSSLLTMNQTFQPRYLTVSLEVSQRSHMMWRFGRRSSTRDNVDKKTVKLPPGRLRASKQAAKHELTFVFVLCGVF